MPAKVSITTIVQGAWLDGGEEKHFWWNNAVPGKAYVLEVVPKATGSYQHSYSEEVEITRQWRKLNVTHINAKNRPSELEIHYTVKCLGEKGTFFDVLLVAIGA